MNSPHTIAIVGNAESLLGSNLGPAIDECDEVVRFSAFEIKGYEKDVGTKTNTWFGYMTPHPLLSTFDRVIFPRVGLINLDTKIKNMKTACAFYNKPFAVLTEELNLIAHEKLNLCLYDESDKRKPTSGFVGIICCMLICKRAYFAIKIYIAGFDGYTSGNHYYAPSTTPKNVHNKHLPEKEMEIINEWISEKKIYHLAPTTLKQ